MIHSFSVPITVNPPIKTYPGYAYVLSLLFAKSNNYFPWLLNHYIQALGNEKGTRYEFMPSDPFHVAEGVMEYMSTSIFPDMLYDDHTFFDVVAAMLQDGFGLTCRMNERFIPNRWAYRYYDFVHDNMVTGYNEKERTFSVLGYAPSGQYVLTEVPIAQVIESLTNDKQLAVSLNFIRPNSNFVPAFCYDIVTNQIKHYLESTSIGEMGHSEFYGKSNWETGIHATQKLLCFPIGETEKFDLRLYSFLKDRVTLMHQRAQYMMVSGYICYDDAVLSDLSHAVKLANNVHLLAIKYNILKRAHCISTIRRNIEEIIQMEESALPYLVGN